MAAFIRNYLKYGDIEKFLGATMGLTSAEYLVAAILKHVGCDACCSDVKDDDLDDCGVWERKWCAALGCDAPSAAALKAAFLALVPAYIGRLRLRQTADQIALCFAPGWVLCLFLKNESRDVQVMGLLAHFLNLAASVGDRDSVFLGAHVKSGFDTTVSDAATRSYKHLHRYFTSIRALCPDGMDDWIKVVSAIGCVLAPGFCKVHRETLETAGGLKSVDFSGLPRMQSMLGWLHVLYFITGFGVVGQAGVIGMAFADPVDLGRLLFTPRLGGSVLRTRLMLLAGLDGFRSRVLALYRDVLCAVKEIEDTWSLRIICGATESDGSVCTWVCLAAELAKTCNANDAWTTACSCVPREQTTVAELF